MSNLWDEVEWQNIYLTSCQCDKHHNMLNLDHSWPVLVDTGVDSAGQCWHSFISGHRIIVHHPSSSHHYSNSYPGTHRSYITHPLTANWFKEDVNWTIWSWQWSALMQPYFIEQFQLVIFWYLQIGTHHCSVWQLQQPTLHIWPRLYNDPQ